MEAQNGGIAYELLTDGLGANASKTYDLRLWFDESMTKEQGASKKYQGKVIVGASADVNHGRNLREAILANNEVKTPITTPGAAVSTADEALLASTEDDYGTSYYFRGAVTNNYVEFANKCWRIVRITGNGSIKLVLNNVNSSGAKNPCSILDNKVAFIQGGFPFNANSDDNAYLGFKYGTAGASNYASAHANTNKSTILEILEDWYNNNLKTYEKVIADTVWCNDKTNVTDKTYDPWGYIPNGLGYAKNVTYYGATQRLVSKSKSAGGTGPSLKCNGELSKITSKVGLITADELAYAGYAYKMSNTTTYLQENATATDTWWWSLSPSIFDGVTANIWFIHGESGTLNTDYYSSDFVIRPAISLISSIEVTGSGTSENPYKVV